MELRTDLGRRIGAALVDFIPLGVLFVVLALTIGESDAGDGEVSLYLDGGPAVIFFALTLVYYIACEAASGRTLGKLVLKMRVVRADGSRPGFGQIVGRNLMRVIDILPALYLVGFIAALATGDRGQRLGDMAAKTFVVRD